MFIFDHDMKFRRAMQYLTDIKDFTEPWRRGDRHFMRTKRNPEDGALVFLATAQQPPTDPLGLLIGEFLHNLRSGLDNLAYALGASYTDPLPRELASTSEFPIFGDADRSGALGTGSARFHQRKKTREPVPGSGLSKIAGWHPDAQTVVEGFQPYKRGKDYTLDPLWQLHELDRINKHRLIHTCAAVGAGITIDMDKSYNFKISGPLQVWDGVVETDTPIAYGPFVPEAPDVKMHVEINPPLDVALTEELPGVHHEPVLEVLGRTYAEVVGRVEPGLRPFLT